MIMINVVQRPFGAAVFLLRVLKNTKKIFLSFKKRGLYGFQVKWIDQSSEIV